MTLVDAFVISTRCRDADELSEKDKYVKRFLADEVIKHKLSAEKLPLEHWNEAIELFGGQPEETQQAAYDTLMALLGGPKGGADIG